VNRTGLVLVAVFACAWALTVAAAYRSTFSDLTQDYLSARALRNGQSVYTPMPARWVLADTNEVVVNDHPPPYVLALSPLGLLPYPVAFLLLAVANSVAGVAAVAIVGRELGWSARVTALGAIGLLVHPGTIACLCVGSISLLLLLVIALGWREFRRNRTGLAGAWLGAAAAIKLYPGLLLIGLGGQWSWRGLGIATATVLACWGAAALATGNDLATYALERAPENARTFVGHGFNLSAAGAAHRAFGSPNEFSPWLERVAVNPTVAEVLTWTSRALVGLLVFFGVWRARRQPDYPDRAFAVLVPGMLLLSPLTWLHAVPMMLIPVAILARSETGLRRVVLVAGTLALCVNDHWLATQWIAITGENVPWTVNLVLLAPTWGMLGVLALAASKPRGPDA
jgi:hypothetical protein